jgi:hypothetical protein
MNATQHATEIGPVTTSAAAAAAHDAVITAAEKHVDATSKLVSLLRSAPRSKTLTRAANGVLETARDVTLAIGDAREAHVDHIAAEAFGGDRPRFGIGRVVWVGVDGSGGRGCVVARERHDGEWFYDVLGTEGDIDALPESALSLVDPRTTDVARPRLSFYDFHRQVYSDTAGALPDRVLAEFMVGDYDAGYGVREGGEFAITIRDLTSGGPGGSGLSFGGPRVHHAVRFEVFGDGLGSLRELLRTDAPDRLAALPRDGVTRRAVTEVLLAAGLTDRSDRAFEGSGS